MFDVFMDDVRPCPSGWKLCRTVADTKLLLEAGLVDRLMLDHDMGEDEDGTTLLHWMIETGHWPKERPTVHSANPVAAVRMRGMIERYYPNDQDPRRNSD